jgi:hypothetical protein
MVQYPEPSQLLTHPPIAGQSPRGSVPAAAGTVSQPTVPQRTNVHGAVGDGQPLPPWQSPEPQTVALVQTSPSSHDAPSLPGVDPHPVAGSHVAASHGDAGVGQTRVAPPPQSPSMQD